MINSCIAYCVPRESVLEFILYEFLLVLGHRLLYLRNPQQTIYFLSLSLHLYPLILLVVEVHFLQSAFQIRLVGQLGTVYIYMRIFPTLIAG